MSNGPDNYEMNGGTFYANEYYTAVKMKKLF